MHLTAAVATVLSLAGRDIVSRSVVAPNQRGALLVSPEWLATHLDDPKLVLLHVGDAREYAAEHIPGARFISLRDISAPPAPGVPPLEMLPPDELRRRLERLGISDDSRIVVYFATDWVSPAARVVLTLDWIGLGARTSLLDGGMRSWKRAGKPVTSAAPAPPKPGRLTAGPVRPGLIVDHAVVLRSIRTPGVAIVDARTPMFYEGPRHGDQRAGHIPGAVNIPFDAVFDDDLRLLGADSLRTVFRAAGVRTGQTLIVYCHIGQQASAVIFAARTLGHAARLYDGSFTDWSARRELPVEP